MMKNANIRRFAAAGLSALFPAVCLNALPPVTAAAAGTVVINEVCTKNTTIAAPDGQFYDYVELYNTGSSAVSLAGYGLTDDAEQPYAYTFPATTVPAKGFAYVWCGVKEGAEVTGAPFGLSKNGETLTLTDANGTQVEQLEVSGLSDDNAFGRVPDGSETFAVIGKLSPGSANPTNATEKIAVEAPAFSKESGFYSSEFNLTLTAKQGCTVYYTTDGSDPDTSSTRYSSAIRIYDKSDEPNVLAEERNISNSYFPPSDPVDKAMIVRAIAVDSDGNVSDIITKTYFIGYGDNEFVKNMRVISLVTDPDNLFDYETGIYVYGKTYDDWKNGSDYDPRAREWEQPANFTQKGKAWERPAHITVFESGEAAYSTEIGIRIHGGATRSNAQKSFNLYARADYGDTKIRYDFFDGAIKTQKGKVIDTFDKLTLRNGGNDSTTKIRDRINQEAVPERAFGTQAQTECVVFIDGEFWGAYNIVEKLDKTYISDHFGVKEDTVCMIKNDELEEGSDQGFADYEALKQLADQANTPQIYEQFIKIVDPSSFADYMATELIIGNSDFGDNNYCLWKTETVDETRTYADGIWRFVLFDTEYGQGLYGQSNSNTNSFQTLKQKNKWITKLFFGLLDNSEEFRNLFVERYFDLCNENFKADKMTAAVSRYEQIYTEIDAATVSRFSGGGGGMFPGMGFQQDPKQSVKSEISTIQNFWRSRDTNAKQHLLNYLGNKVSSQVFTVTVTDPKDAGSIGLNSIPSLTFTNGTWSGTYPASCLLKLQATAADGYEFSSWKVTDALFANGNASSSTAEIQVIETQATVQAVFEEGAFSPDTYTAADARKLQKYLLTNGSLTSQEAQKYDMDHSGKLTAADLTMLKAKALKAAK